MSVREWADDESLIKVEAVTETFITDTFTVGALLNPNVKNDWESIFSARDVGNSALWSFGTNPDNLPYFYKNDGNKLYLPVSGGTVTPDNWWFIVYTILDADTGAGVFRIAQLGETPVHIAAEPDDVPLITLDSPTVFQFGATTINSDGLDALYGLATIRNSFLTEAEFNDIVAASSSSELLSANFGGVFEFNQENATDDIPDLAGNHAVISGDLSGGVNNGIQNTTIVTGQDPEWYFGPDGPPSTDRQVLTSSGWESSNRMVLTSEGWV